MVPWMRGTLKKFFLASSTPLAMAAGTSLALPYPTPTVPSPSPTTTRAVKLNRRPPLTTLATRLMVTTRSSMVLFSGAERPSRRSRPPRSLPPRSLPPARGPRCVPWVAEAIRLLPHCCWTCTCGCSSGLGSSELEAGFPGGVGEGGDPAGVAVATPVEDHLGDAGGLGRLGDRGTDLPSLGGLVALAQLEGGGGGQRDALAVVDQLDEQVPGRPGDHQTGTALGADHLLAQPEVPAGLAGPAAGRDPGRAPRALDDR